MPRFRKKPIEVEAIQLRWENWNEVCDFIVAHGGLIRGGWVATDDSFTEGNLPPDDLSPDDARIGCVVTTIHGDEAVVRQNDWIIPESKHGTFYPVKPDIFEATYEPVGAPLSERAQS